MDDAPSTEITSSTQVSGIPVEQSLPILPQFPIKFKMEFTAKDKDFRARQRESLDKSELEHHDVMTTNTDMVSISGDLPEDVDVALAKVILIWNAIVQDGGVRIPNEPVLSIFDSFPTDQAGRDRFVKRLWDLHEDDFGVAGVRGIEKTSLGKEGYEDYDDTDKPLSIAPPSTLGRDMISFYLKDTHLDGVMERTHERKDRVEVYKMGVVPAYAKDYAVAASIYVRPVKNDEKTLIHTWEETKAAIHKIYDLREMLREQYIEFRMDDAKARREEREKGLNQIGRLL